LEKWTKNYKNQGFGEQSKKGCLMSGKLKIHFAFYGWTKCALDFFKFILKVFKWHGPLGLFFSSCILGKKFYMKS
jgi:hypothetical protein